MTSGWSARCALCGADTRQANAITCARTLTGNDCDERLHAEMERLAPGRVWTDSDYRVALDALLAVMPSVAHATESGVVSPPGLLSPPRF